MKIIKAGLYLSIAFLVLESSLTRVYAAGKFCDPAHTRRIPALSETECNAVLYSMFPKITEYKGQLWEAGPSCSNNGAPSQSDLGVQYCKSGHTQGKDSTGNASGENLDFKTTILDMEGPQYASKTNQSLLKVVLFGFDEKMLSPAMHNYQSSNSLFDKNMTRIHMPSGKSTTYVFSALYQKRYLITIAIEGKGRFKEPKDVDAFVLEYTAAMVAGFTP